MQDWRRQTDMGHIKLLAIFHVVVGCLALAGLGFVALHYMMMSTMLPMMERDMAKQHPPGLPPPAEFMQIFVWMYIFFAVILIIAGVLNLLSAYFMSRRSISLSAGGCRAELFACAAGDRPGRLHYHRADARFGASDVRRGGTRGGRSGGAARERLAGRRTALLARRLTHTSADVSPQIAAVPTLTSAVR